MENIKNMIENQINEKLENGEISKIIQTKIDSVFTSIIDDIIGGYNSEFKKTLKEKLAPVFIDALEKSNLDSYTVKLSDIINEALSEGSFKNYSETIQAIRKIADPISHGIKTYDISQKVSLSSIFKDYIEFIKNCYEVTDASNYTADEIDDNSVCLDVSITVEDVGDEYSFFSSTREKKKIVLTTSKTEECIRNGLTSNIIFARNTKVEFEIQKSFFDNKWSIAIDRDIAIRDLRNAPPFIVNLIAMRNAIVDIDIDIRNEVETVQVSVSE